MKAKCSLAKSAGQRINNENSRRCLDDRAGDEQTGICMCDMSHDSDGSARQETQELGVSQGIGIPYLILERQQSAFGDSGGNHRLIAWLRDCEIKKLVPFRP